MLEKGDGSKPPSPWWHHRAVAYSLPLLFLVMVAFGLTLQISDDAQQRDDGILFAFVLQVLAFGWWYVLDTAVWRRNTPAIPYGKVLSYDAVAPPAGPMELTAMVGGATLLLERRDSAAAAAEPRRSGGAIAAGVGSDTAPARGRLQRRAARGSASLGSPELRRG